jgi:tetratricopeptide (TPR) repeat protein
LYFNGKIHKKKSAAKREFIMDGRQKEISPVDRAHHLLTQGKGDEAQALLAQMYEEASVPRDELAYLHAWSTIVQEQWDDVAQHVRDFPVLLDREERESLLTNGSIRRRRPMCLLMLGEMARELGYPEEANEHIQHCLTLLNERRMNIAEVRLLAHSCLGRLSLESNQTTQALVQYKTALNLCANEAPDHPLHTAILAGLCETHIRLEQFEQALAIGKQALRLHQEGSQPNNQEHILLMLSHISLALEESASAMAYAQDAQHLANQADDHARVAQTLLIQAEIQHKTGTMQEARTNCEQALALLAATPDLPLNGTALFLLGKIAETEWHAHPDQTTLAPEAQARYEQALALFASLHDTTSLASVSKQLAQLLEDRGQPEQALIHWKHAYQLSGHKKAERFSSVIA